ncbi:zinc finger CCCH domain-containing protein 4-like [Argopecten irradians]|uniref:zinc finger CCCH domain-containing protein 4-like n=1 Tax=Argopecten irradians TaxID=31199 RepID=UPI0037176C31
MEIAEEVAENDHYGENDTKQLNSEGEEEEYYGEDYGSEQRRKKSFSDPDEKYNIDNTQEGEGNTDYDNRHVKRRRSGGDHSDGDSDHRHHSRHRSTDQERDRGSHRRRHHRSRRKDRERSRHSHRNNNSRSSQEGELEDGELEDGELDDDDNDYQENITPTKSSPPKLDRKESSEKSSPKKHSSGHSEGHDQEEAEYPENVLDNEGEEEANIEDMERSRPQKDDHDSKRRRKDKRDKDKRRKQQKEEKKKKKRREYHDFDKVEEDYDQAWGTGVDKHANKSQNSRGSRSSYDRSPPGPYEDHFDDQGQYERSYKSPSGGHYDSPYDSPPGPYDSPSYDEDSEGEIYDNHLKPRRTMMSMVEGEYIDANVVLDEGENIYKHTGISNKKMKQMKQMKRKMDRQQQGDQPPKKKPLLLTPMNERPICKFFKEGKCSKGNDCPFNHDYRPPKKMDLCKFYLNSQCSKGDNCIFMHGEFPCKFFHTGANCYSGDNCKFSHDPLTDETAPLVDKFYQDFSQREEEGFGDGQRMGPPRPSLLGSPPRHIAEQSERVKKIPSIFDIKVYPPGQSPKKPLNDGPHQMCGPPSRPSGFYTDMNQPPPMGPPMPHQQGPQMPGPNQQGPHMPGPHQQGPPMSGPHQQGPPMSGPHQQGPPMPGPHQQGPPMPGLRQQGPPMPRPPGPPMPGPHGPPMPGPHMQGPGMQGPPMPGPRIHGPPMQNPPPVSSATMNPAVALVGALLRQAAPQVLRQNAPGQQRPPGPQNMGPPGSQNMPPQFQGPNQTGQFNSPQGMYSSSNDQITSPPHDENSTDQPVENNEVDEPSNVVVKSEETIPSESIKTEPPEPKPEPDKSGTEDTAAEDESNEKKLSTLGLNIDTLTHLPAKQRELFLRIQNQQGDGLKDTQTDEEDKVENVKDEKLDDDNWYSSDEEDTPDSKPKLTDILKNLSQKPTPESPQTPGPTNFSQSSALDIMQMINSIRKGNNTSVGTPDIPANSNPPIFPKTTDVEMPNKAPVTMPEPVIINSSEGDIPYRLRPITVDKSQYAKPPQGLDVHSELSKNDPRIKKFIAYLESQAQKLEKAVKPVGSKGTEEGKLDPRTGQPVDRRVDPRVKTSTDGLRPGDPRFQGSDNQATHSNVPPQLQRPPSNPLMPNLNIGINPRADGQKPMDPRMSRQMSRDGTAASGLSPRQVDPRMGPQDPRMGQQDPRMGPQDPRTGQQDPRMGPQDPRMGPQDPRMGPQDPRMGQQDPRMGPQDQRMGPQDPRMGPQDPRVGHQDLRIGQQDPRMGPNDPRMGPQDPRMGLQDPRIGAQDPRMGQQDLRLGPQDQRMGPQDPRMGLQDPRMGPQVPRTGPQNPKMSLQDPRMGPQDPRMGQQDPRMGQLDPRGLKDPRANSDPRRVPQDSRSTSDMDSQRSVDPRSFQRQGSIGADPRKPPALDPRRPPQGDMQNVQSSSDSESKKTDDSDTAKPKLDYRNDPRFKRKPASESVGHKRYTGQRKSSMDYSSPLGVDSEDKGTYNSYQRSDSAKHKTDPRPAVKLDPRTSKPEGSSPNIDSSPLPPLPPGDVGMPVALELPPFVPPNALEPQMKDFFKTMDPTASPFC